MRLISAGSLVQIQSPPPVKVCSGIDICLLCLIFFLRGPDDEPCFIVAAFAYELIPAKRMTIKDYG